MLLCQLPDSRAAAFCKRCNKRKIRPAGISGFAKGVDPSGQRQGPVKQPEVKFGQDDPQKYQLKPLPDG
jgi:hypothetical protein